jgi:UDP-N-acetylglucosamine 2-epimerase (non-hydrolysing)
LDNGEWPLNLSLQRILDEAREGVTVVTLHRKDNIGTPHSQALAAIRELAAKHPRKRFLFPVHYTPALRKQAFELLNAFENIYLLDPLDYPTLIAVLRKADLVVTDSASLPEDCATMRVPTLMLCEATERPECVSNGFAKLVGTESAALGAAIEAAWADTGWKNTWSERPQVFGDGTAVKKIVRALTEMRGLLW